MDDDVAKAEARVAREERPMGSKWAEELLFQAMHYIGRKDLATILLIL